MLDIFINPSLVGLFRVLRREREILMKIKVYEANNQFEMGSAVMRQNINLAIATVKR